MLRRCRFGTYFSNWLAGIMAATPTLLEIAKNTRVLVVAGSRVAAALQNFTRDDPYGKGVTFVRDQAEKDRVCLILQRFGVQTFSLSRTAAYTLAFLQWTSADFVVCDGGAVPAIGARRWERGMVLLENDRDCRAARKTLDDIRGRAPAASNALRATV